jgi:hypothetical protein
MKRELEPIALAGGQARHHEEVAMVSLLPTTGLE